MIKVPRAVRLDKIRIQNARRFASQRCSRQFAPRRSMQGDSPHKRNSKAIRLDKNAKFKKVIRLAVNLRKNSHLEFAPQDTKCKGDSPAPRQRCNVQGDSPHKRNSKAIRLDKDTILKAIRLDKKTTHKAVRLAEDTEGDSPRQRHYIQGNVPRCSQSR